MDDATLLREYALYNSEAAFEGLVSRYVDFVHSAAMRQMRDPHIAKDVTQVVFIILAKNAGRIRDDINLSGWLFKTTRFVAMAQIRAAARRRHYEQESHMQFEDQIDTPDHSLWEQISPLLDDALTKLGEKDREAVLLRFFHNKSLAEVGSSFGTGEDAARMRINRALAKLHRYFNRHGVSSTTAALAAAISTNSIQAAPFVLIKTIATGAVTKGATASGTTLTLIQGALKIMAWTKVKTVAVTAIVLFLVGGSTTMVVVETQSGRGPIGALIEQKRQKDALMAQMDSMRAINPAIGEFAGANQDELPKTLMELKPYLPANLSGMDDEHWEILVRGKRSALMRQPGWSRVLLLQQKDVPSDKAKIRLYADGSITYQK